MNVTAFITLFAICSIATALVTEGEKQLFTDFPKNLLAMVTGIVVGMAVCCIYYFYSGITYTAENTVTLVILAILSGFGSMLGYDKVTQTIKQILEKLEG